jgi:hypothetical protein
LPEGVKIGDFIASVKSHGYAAMVQTSALSDAEVLVTEKVRDADP